MSATNEDGLFGDAMLYDAVAQGDHASILQRFVLAARKSVLSSTPVAMRSDRTVPIIGGVFFWVVLLDLYFEMVLVWHFLFAHIF